MAGAQEFQRKTRSGTWPTHHIHHPTWPRNICRSHLQTLWSSRPNFCGCHPHAQSSTVFSSSHHHPLTQSSPKPRMVPVFPPLPSPKISAIPTPKELQTHLHPSLPAPTTPIQPPCLLFLHPSQAVCFHRCWLPAPKCTFSRIRVIL